MNLGPAAIRIAVSFLLLSAVALVGQSDDSEARFHSLVPLGAEAYDIQGQKWKGMMTLLASAESPQFEGMSRRTDSRHAALFSADGRAMENYPERVSFRVTASFRARITDASPFPISASGDENDYLLKLKFRIVVFDGLRQTVIHPTVEMIGVPDELPYDERIYRVSADLGDIPLTDRVVLEIQDPDGGRICKFHLDLI